MMDPAYSLDSVTAEMPEDEAEIRDVKPVPRISLQVFCDTPEVYNLVEAASGDRRLVKAFTKIHMGGIPAAIDFYGDAPTPNLIIAESTQPPMQLLASLDRLAEVCDSGSKVVIIGHVNDVDLYRELIRRGVSEYIVMPFTVMDFIAAISELYVDRESKPVGRSIAFFGAKGGVGSSTMAHNVAWAIARSHDGGVTLIDLDLPFGTAGLDLNKDPVQGIADAVNSPDRIDDVFLDRLLAKCTENLNLLAAPATVDKTYDFSADVFSQVLDVARKTVPTVIIDVPHIWSSWTKSVLVTADEIVITATPDLASLRNAKNIFDQVIAARPNDRPPQLVLNMTEVPKRPEISPGDFGAALNIEPTAVIKFEPQLFATAANNGQMISELAANHEVAATIGDLAQIVLHRTQQQQQKRSGLAPLLQRFLPKKKKS